VVALALALPACDPAEGTLPAGDPASHTALRELRDHACACKDPGCSYRVMSELLAYSDEHKVLRETQAASSLADEIARCLDTAARAEPIAMGIDAGVRPPSYTGMPACDDYLALVERYLQCDQFPQAARDSTRQAVDQMQQAWRDMANLPPDVRRTAEDACKQASDAMRQAGSAMGCDLGP
jgi:hypothetical protein